MASRRPKTEPVKALVVRYDARLDGDGVQRRDDVVHVGRDQGEAGVGEVETIGTKIILGLLRASDRAAADRSWRRATELHKAVFRRVLIDLGAKTREVEQEKVSDRGVPVARAHRLLMRLTRP